MNCYGQQPYSFARSSGHIMMGQGLAAPHLVGSGHIMNVSKIFGTGKKDLTSGLMPGEHIVPEREVQKTLYHYKHMRGLHPNQHLPASHIMSIMEQAHRHSNINPMDHQARGGFLPALLPLLTGTILPLVGKAAMPLLSGAMGALGARIGNIGRGNGLPTGTEMHHHNLFESGVPRRVMGNNMDPYWHIHGEGFRDWISRAYRKVRGVATSQPVRMLGAHALKTIQEALMNALTEKVNGWTGDAVEKIAGFRPQQNMSIREEMARKKAREAAGLSPPGYEEITRVSPNATSVHEENDMAPRGAGRKRGRTMMGKGVGKMTKKRLMEYRNDLY